MIISPQGHNLVSQVGGKYADWCRAGFIYVARSSAAAAIPVNTALTNSPTLWNPANSGKCIIPLSISMSIAGLGTQIIDGFTISYLTDAGREVASGLPIATWADIQINQMKLNNSLSRKVSSARFANGTVTFTAQPVALLDLGMGQWVSGTAGTGSAYNNHLYRFEGELELEPGTAISIGAATAASSGTYWTSIVYAEIPLSYYEGNY